MDPRDDAAGKTLGAFHPAVSAWFRRRFSAPTAPQIAAWPAIQARTHVLVAAPTGSGKTLAAFLACIDELVREAVGGGLPDETRVVYVSPLKALSNDIRLNLEEPLAGVREELAALGLADAPIRAQVRSGDTTPTERARMGRRPPHILVTTPESLYILLGSESGRRMLASARSVILDEIHALAGTKRGAHLALSLERLEALSGRRLARIGLSATQKPVEEVGRLLVGAAQLRPDGMPDCLIVDAGHRRERDLGIELPPTPLEAVLSGEQWEQVYDRLAALSRAHRTTLVFVNTRRLAERVTRHLSERLGEEAVAAHHGSLAKELRFDAEQRLKRGALKVLVATASLELGIDIGDVDLVCQLGAPRSISAFLQRVGRAGHAVGGVSKGRLFPLTRDELAECAALLDAVRRGELDRLQVPAAPLDVLAQQVVAETAASEWGERALYERFTRAWPYRELTIDAFGQVLGMLAEGFSTRRGRRGALIHWDRVNGVIRGRRGARMTAITSGGAIPDTADYAVILEPEGQFIGTVNEDFAVESLAGDIFQLGNVSYRIRRVERGTVRVEDARGQPPGLPFWLGEAPSRSDELSFAVSRLRSAIADALGRGGPEAARAWLEAELQLSAEAAAQIADYHAAALGALGALPTQSEVVLERFFDESGGMQLVVHSPFGGRINRAWGLALRKRFCRQFNFELQAAATENSIVLSLTGAHSFALDEVAGYLRAASVRPLLVQALLAAPMFATRWRWNAGIALALPRMRSGRKIAPQIRRMEAEDLLAAVFPDQLACAENVVGEREVPDHPLVAQTVADCLTEAMDVEGLERLLADIEAGRVKVRARDLAEPSPLAQEVLTARPYAYLDDAPLEERRTQAVMSRRWLDPASAADLGRLDPQAIARVREEAWPDAASVDELHDALCWLGFLTGDEAAARPDWAGWLASLAGAGRAARVGGALWTAAERLPQWHALDPSIRVPDPFSGRLWSREDALRELLRGRLEGLGPVVAEALGRPLGLAEGETAAALAALETEGFCMRGRFTGDAEEWCERRLLARIHRYTVNRLRAEIEPVQASDFLRFLFEWQRVAPGARMEGPDAVAATVAQLEGFEAPAAAWETELLPSRIRDYEPAWLDDVCRAGRVAWARLSSRNGDAQRGPAPVRTTPIALLQRRHSRLWAGLAVAGGPAAQLSSKARAVAAALEAHGASFFDELVEASRLLRTQVEEGLAELVALGLANADSFSGLRALLVPADRRSARGGRRRRGTAIFGMEDAGRWSLVRRGAPAGEGSEAVEHVARALLRRYGVVFWRLLEREAAWLPPWRSLLMCWRRLEARGEIRGGRFVAGFTGEQYALPEAVGLLREVRRRAPDGLLVSLSGADPLNLAGILTPGPRLPALTGNRVLYRDGVPLALWAAGEMRWLEALEGAAQWQARNVLLRRPVPESLADLG